MKKQFFKLFLMGAILAGFGFQIEYGNNAKENPVDYSNVILPTGSIGGKTVIPGEYSSHSDTKIICAPGFECATIVSDNSTGTSYTLRLLSTQGEEFHGTPIYDVVGNVVAFETANQTMDIIHVD